MQLHIFFNFCFCFKVFQFSFGFDFSAASIYIFFFSFLGLTVVSLSCELFCPFEHRGSSVSIFFIFGFDLEFPSSFIFIFTSYVLFSFSISFRQSGCLISYHECFADIQGATSSEHPITLAIIHSFFRSILSHSTSHFSTVNILQISYADSPSILTGKWST